MLVGALVLLAAAQPSGVGPGPVGSSVLSCAGANVVACLARRARVEAVSGPWAAAGLGFVPAADSRREVEPLKSALLVWRLACLHHGYRQDRQAPPGRC